jgi:hypothetical protein
MPYEEVNVRQMARDSEWITVREMQRILSIGRSKAYEICAQEEEIETVQLNTAIRINKASLDRWLRQQRYPRWRDGVSTTNQSN